VVAAYREPSHLAATQQQLVRHFKVRPRARDAMFGNGEILGAQVDADKLVSKLNRRNAGRAASKKRINDCVSRRGRHAIDELAHKEERLRAWMLNVLARS
jgi:hypothetical protein